MAELNWTEAHWQRVNEAVTETFGKASVASAFLPMYGPLSGSAEIVRNEQLRFDESSSSPPTISLDKDYPGVNLRLINLTVRVKLSGEQIADEELSNAMLAFRRAASVLAQESDRVVFEGLRKRPRDQDSKFVANEKMDPHEGLADLQKRYEIFHRFEPGQGSVGQAVVAEVVRATGELENAFNPGPFACVLGSELFTRVHDPSQSLVLPADRIAPLLKGGPLLRSTTMNEKAGVVVSLAGGAVDMVIGTPPTVQFLQRTAEGKYLFRVYERFALRIRDASKVPVAGFRVRISDEEDAKECLELRLAKAEAAVP